MTREKFGWEREEQFNTKRLKLAESIIEPRKALVVIVGGLAFLFLVFFVSPPLLFGPAAGLVTLIPLMALFVFIALGNRRLLRINDESDEGDFQVDVQQGHAEGEPKPSGAGEEESKPRMEEES